MTNFFYKDFYDIWVNSKVTFIKLEKRNMAMNIWLGNHFRRKSRNIFYGKPIREYRKPVNFPDKAALLQI